MSNKEQKNGRCPFCGGHVDPTGWLRGDGVRGPECESCGATAPNIDLWNRASEPVKVAFSALSYGAKFKYELEHGQDCIYVKIGHDKVAAWDERMASSSWRAQGIYSFAGDDNDLTKAVYLVRDADIKAAQGEGEPSSCLADFCEACEKRFIGLDGSTKWCSYCGARHEGATVSVSTVVQPQGEQLAHMPVERCYDVRAKMIIAFNEARKNGGDLDDALDAAYKSALRYSPNPMTAEQPAPVAAVLDLISNPTIEMQEAGSLASDYDLSQERAAKVWKAMAGMALTRMEQGAKP